MEEEYTPIEFDEEIHEYDDYGNIVLKEPEGGWEDYEKWINEERAKEHEEQELQNQYEKYQEQQRELEEQENPFSIDELIEMDQEMLREDEEEVRKAAGGYLEIAEKCGAAYAAAIRYLVALMRKNVRGASELLVNFGKAMAGQQYAFQVGYLFQIEQTELLEQKGCTILAVEPSIKQWVGETRYGDVLILDSSKKEVIVEIKNWTGYLKGVSKKASSEEFNEREKERKEMLGKLKDQLERYVKTGKNILFIWKGQLPIDVYMLLLELAKRSNGSFQFKTA